MGGQWRFSGPLPFPLRQASTDREPRVPYLSHKRRSGNPLRALPPTAAFTRRLQRPAEVCHALALAFATGEGARSLADGLESNTQAASLRVEAKLGSLEAHVRSLKTDVGLPKEGVRDSRLSVAPIEKQFDRRRIAIGLEAKR